ncbi:protein-disulfide reductase DsbD family protein [Puniceicoccus vermicola]|uniref:Thioredoxin family protein n=1 Tax=Puniceicoccus vermicola TaxID=388746 RepID=A0A7X1AVG8_9BACT|nr:protein-disulfide reductase DsbD domain-containing protein [Puniceicoccus vermicola]MBC2600702.1 thioredoxin family protein [Puniceicoccus vermicola]
MATIFLLSLASTLSLSALTSKEVRDGEVAVQLVTPAETATPGQTIAVGVRFLIDEGWHIYWKNPGDTGLETSIAWALPEGVGSGELHWPYPHVYRNAHLVDFVYSDEVTLYTDVRIPEDWPTGKDFPISAEVDWLMCAEICIPGKGELSFNLPVAETAQTDAVEEEAFETVRAEWPATAETVSAEIRSNAQKIQLIVDGLELEDDGLTDTFFFPIDPIVAPGGDQEWLNESEKLVGNLVRSEYAPNIPDEVSGVLVNPEGWSALDGRKALLIQAAHSDQPPASFAGTTGSAPSGNLAGLLLLAFAGGAILNLMPCVFPVLGLKIMGFVEQAGNEKRKIIGHGLLFALGVLVSFWVLAGALLILRAGGAELGWGFQLQSAPFVFGMAIFLFLFALNLSGVFEIGFGLMSLGNKADRKKGAGGSFLSGILATVVATPCSAPFLATALAGALTLPPFQSFLTFTCIALGLAAPYLLLSLFPALLKKLPKPGAWMETLKEFMAFPLYATVGWLLYVLAGQVDGSNLLHILLSFTLLALAAWIYGRYATPHRKPRTRLLGNAAALLFAGISIAYGYPQKDTLQWIPWSPETVQSLRESDRPVYVDFTARWCATCQVNKAVVFSNQEVLDYIGKQDVALVKADWTNEDPAITRRLTELGKAAVPVNLVYLPGEDSPEVLPETLTPGIVLRALRGE